MLTLEIFSAPNVEMSKNLNVVMLLDRLPDLLDPIDHRRTAFECLPADPTMLLPINRLKMMA